MGTICILIAVAFIIAMIVMKAIQENRRREMEAAQAAYRNSIENPKRDPHNPDKRQKALILGRIYACQVKVYKESLGQKTVKGVTIFDEIALMNDINAACAGAGNPTVRSKRSIQERLATLDDLRARNLVSEDEYRKRRQQIIDEL